MTRIEKAILKHTLLNAIQYNGKADVQAVLSKVIAENPEWKSRIKKIPPGWAGLMGYLSSFINFIMSFLSVFSGVFSILMIEVKSGNESDSGYYE